MPVERGDDITNAHFNALVTALVNNYSSWLGQQLRPGTKNKTVGETIRKTDWSDLAQDVYDYANFAWTGEPFGRSTIFTSSIWRDSWTVPDDRNVEDVDYNELETAINSANLRLPNILDSDMAFETYSFSYTETWNNILKFDAAIRFQGGYTYTSGADGTTSIATPADHIRHYSRAKARITTIGSGSGATTDKDLDWKAVAESLNEPWRPSDYTGSNFVTLESSQGGANYGDNVGRILLRRETDLGAVTGTDLRIRIEYQDNDTGNDPKANPIYDENVDTDMGMENIIRYPDRLPNDLKPQYVELGYTVELPLDQQLTEAVPEWSPDANMSITYFDASANSSNYTLLFGNDGSGTDTFIIVGSVGQLNNSDVSTWHPQSSWDFSQYEIKLAVTSGNITFGSGIPNNDWVVVGGATGTTIGTFQHGVGFRSTAGTLTIRRLDDPASEAVLNWSVQTELGAV